MDALFSGVAAVVECVLGLLKFLFCGFFNLAQALMDPGLDRRERRLRSVVALVQIAVPFLIVGGGIWIFALMDERANQKIRLRQATGLAVNRLADRLDSKMDADGRYVRASGDLLQADAWGRPLAVEYRDQPWGESLVVFSSGPDQRVGTPDDIAAERSNIRATDVAKTLAGQVGETLKRKILNRDSGAAQRE